MLRYKTNVKTPDLYRTVKSFMIHGPCGVLKPHSVCMVDDVRSKMFRMVLTKKHLYQLMATCNTGDVTMGVQYK